MSAIHTLPPAPQTRPFRRAIAAVAWALLATLPGMTSAAEEMSAGLKAQIQAVLAEKEGRTPAQKKMDSQLVYLAKQRRKEVIAAAAPHLVPDVKTDAKDRVLLDFNATVSAELHEAITKGGGTIVNQFAAFHAIRALVPIGIVETLAARGDVRSIARAALGTTNVGSVLGEGDRTHRADAARAATEATGTGIKIGVLSDGVDSLATSIANGNLNATATFLVGQAGTGDEGTAMMEIIQDIVPDARLVFATGKNGPASMAANILTLQAAGCSIIVDDWDYGIESPFQDQVVAQAINTVSAAGVMYFSSAGNSGNKNDGTSGTWEGDFVSGGVVGTPVPGKVLDFGGGVSQNIVGTGGNLRSVSLFWSDPLGGSANDYDVLVLDSTGTIVLRSSTNVQTGTQDPSEFIDTLNPGERIVVVQHSGAADRFIHLETGRGALTVNTSGFVGGHNACGAANAFCVAATDVAHSPSPNVFTGGATNPVETFSSDGPRRMFFDPNGTPFTPGNFSSTGGIVLNKPDLTAADGVATSVPGFSPFYGTSAAAPHAAAIAALLKSYNPALTPAQIRTAMTSTALDIDTAGDDRDSGVGIVTALAAIQSVAAPPVVISGPSLFIASGPGGGTFYPGFATYTVTNTGMAALNWTASKTQPWTDLSSTGGTLAPGSTATITCSFNAAAKGLALGSYADFVTISTTASSLTRKSYFGLQTVPGQPTAPVTVPVNDNAISANARAPIATFRFERGVYLITASELAAKGLSSGVALQSIGWNYQTAPGLAGAAPLTIYLQNTSDTTNLKSATWDTAVSGMTVAHNATTTLPNVTGGFDIPFSGGTPFVYTGGGLYVAFDWNNYAGTLSTSAVVFCNSTGLANGLLAAQSTTGAPPTLTASSFRPETRLGYNLPVPVVILNPAKVTVSAGDTAIFSALAIGVPTPTAQWQWSFDGGVTFSDIAGWTTTTVYVQLGGADNGTQFRAVFTNSAGSATTLAATLTVKNFAPIVTASPGSGKGIVGETATLRAAAGGDPAPTVQWQRSSDGGATFNDISGATSVPLIFSLALTDNGAQYHAVFTNVYGSATTAAATLTVRTAQGDFNLDGKTDLLAFNPVSRRSQIITLNGAGSSGTIDGPVLPNGWILIGYADFNGDGDPDYLLFQPGTGKTRIWYLDAVTYLGAKGGPTLPAGYELAATADFDGDGKPDFLLVNKTTRKTEVWFMDNNKRKSRAAGPVLPAGYELAGAADFDGDGHPDLLLWQPATRQTTVWYLAGATGTIYDGAVDGPAIPLGYTLAGTPDLNGDGQPDLLLVNDATRATKFLYLQNATLTGSADGPTLPAGDFLAREIPAPDVADVNRDGYADLALFNAATGATEIQYLKGAAVLGSPATGPVLPGGWTLVDVTNIDGDGNTDYVLYQPGTRQTAIWYLNGTTFQQSKAGPTLPVGYELVATGDFNDDGHADFVLVNPATGETAIWFMNKAAKVGKAVGPTLPPGCKLVGVADFDADSNPDFVLFNPTTQTTMIYYLTGTTLNWSAAGPTIPTGYMLGGVSDLNGDGRPDFVLVRNPGQATLFWYLYDANYLRKATGPTLPAGYSLVAP